MNADQSNKFSNHKKQVSWGWASPFTWPFELCHIVITGTGVPRVRGGNPSEAAHENLWMNILAKEYSWRQISSNKNTYVLLL